jgi:AcrR family transcriptional regulator
MATVQVRSNGHSRIRGEDRRLQILATATELFAQQGYGGTTTRQIADTAGVNEALIFRHFPSKEELYWAVIEHKCLEGQGRKIVRDRLAAKGAHQEIFAGIAEDFLRMREKDGTLGRLLLYSALENHRLSHRFFRTHIAELYEELAGYIREQIQAGTFRDTDPLVAARGFWGMVVYHFLIQELFGGNKYQKLDSHDVANTLAEIWLRGMEPDGGAVGLGRSNGGRRARRQRRPSQTITENDNQ